MSDPLDETPGHSCGVFGVYAPGAPVAHLVYLGLYALQHRGQESAGIAITDGEHITVVKEMGLVASVFNERTLGGLAGHAAIGHTRYSTTGSSSFDASQPFFRAAGDTELAIAHNGNLTNTAELIERHALDGLVVSDTDLVAELLARQLRRLSSQPSLRGLADEVFANLDAGVSRERAMLRAALGEVLGELRGGFTFSLVTRDYLVGVRDPHGFWPLCLGRVPVDSSPGGWVLASETPALDVVGAEFVREVAPGEVVLVGPEGVESFFPFSPAAGEASAADAPSAAERDGKPHGCIFEFVYFSRPDSVLSGRSVAAARHRMGELLAASAPVDADFVMPVPESGIPAAQGFAHASRLAYRDGLVKNRYIGRTFIAPNQQLRSVGVRRKLNPIRSNIAGQRLVVVDDSIVRGTTTREIVAMLRAAGAAQVHLRVSSPPYRFPCHYGMDTGSASELLASRLGYDERDASSHRELERYLGVDSLAFLSFDDLIEAVGGTADGFCTACLTAEYPVDVPTVASRVSVGARADEYQGELMDVRPGRIAVAAAR